MSAGLALAILWIGWMNPIASAEPIEQQGGPPAEITSPGLVAAGYGEWLWVIWLGPETEGATAGQSQVRPGGETGTAQIVAKQANHEWSEVQKVQLSRLLTAAARNDRMDVLVPSGSHFSYQPTGYHTRLAPLPADFTPICLAGNGNQLYALASRSGKAASQPATMSERGPVRRSLHLLAQNDGEWKERPPLPNTLNLLWASHASLTVHLKQPVVLATVDGKLVYARLTEANQWQVRPVQPATRPEKLGEVKAASINKRLYVVGWPDLPAALPFVARIGNQADADGTGPLTVEDVHGFPAVQPELDLKTRYHQWDLTVSNDRLVLLRKPPKEPGLQVRRYDPGSKTFDNGDDWQNVVGLGQTTDWATELFHHRALLPIMLSVMVLAFLIRRPGGLIRLPIDVEPAQLWQRGIALLIDMVPAALIASMVIYGSDDTQLQQDVRAFQNGQPTGTLLVMSGLLVGLLAVYSTVAETLFATTLGKRVFRLRVYAVTGTRPGFARVLVRNLLKVIELWLFPLVMVMMIFHPARQRMGDLLAGTIVVGPRMRPLPPWARPSGPPPPPPSDHDGTPPAGPDEGE
jgi:uncharacterized RDD family membrane protein YckC